jgi:DNA-directed RNA polymerase subunit E'/Rpb7
MSSSIEFTITPIYRPIILTTTLFIKPNLLNHNIDEILLQQLRLKVEGICIKSGYIKPGSVHILSRTAGKMNIGMFDGNASFIVKYEAQVCNPAIGEIIECQVSDINKAAISAFIEDASTTPLNIFMARQHHIGNTEFFALKTGDIIKIKILGKTYNYRDTNILVFGQYMN